MEQINPHMSKNECLILLEKNLIFGCAGPFKLVDNKAEICDYI